MDGDSRRLLAIRATRPFWYTFRYAFRSPAAKNLNKHRVFRGNIDWRRGSELSIYPCYYGVKMTDFPKESSKTCLTVLYCF